MRKGDVRRQAILDTAETLFGTKGYLETTVEDVLSELGCSKGSFYHYFDSKLSVLQAICEAKVQRSFERYQKTRVGSTREKLNALLYWMQPFRAEEEAFLLMLLRLRLRGESIMMDGTMRRVQRAQFKPELENLLMVLNETGAARIARRGLDDVVFEAYTAFYDQLCEAMCACVTSGENTAYVASGVVEAARFLWERVLDMEYGSVELVRLEETLPLLERVVQRLRL